MTEDAEDTNCASCTTHNCAPSTMLPPVQGIQRKRLAASQPLVPLLHSRQDCSACHLQAECTTPCACAYACACVDVYCMCMRLQAECTTPCACAYACAYVDVYVHAAPSRMHDSLRMCICMCICRRVCACGSKQNARLPAHVHMHVHM